MKYICPLVVVADIKKSRYLYEKVLGQKVKVDMGENLLFHGDFALHQENHFRILIKNNPVIKRSHSFELYFEEDNVETLEAKLKGEGIEFLHETIEQPWRQKVVRFYDYDGNVVEIGESLEHVAYRLSLEGMTPQEISRITYLPEDVVLSSIEEFAGSV